MSKDKEIEKNEHIDQHLKNKVVLNGLRTGNSIRGELEIHDRTIQIPNFIFELGGPEDFNVAIKHGNLLPDTHIISIPAYHWESLSQSIVPTINKELHNKSLDFVSKHHLLTYEPPEYYRFIMPHKLVSHAMRGDRGKSRKFYKLALIENNKDDGLNMLPSFEREFIKKQWDILMWQHYSKMKYAGSKSLKKIKKKPKRPNKSPEVEAAWNNVDQSYFEHLAIGLLEAISMGWSCSFVPPVRTLKASSEKYVRKQVIKQLKAVDYLWNVRLKGYRFPSGRPWLHLSLDKSIFEKNSETTPQDLIDIINETLLISPTYCGVCITMTGWQDAWTEGKPRRRLEDFLIEVSDIGFSENKPIYLARSKWVGIDLLDTGATFAGTILSGNERILNPSPMNYNDPKSFGKVPIYGECREVLLDSLFKKGKNIGEFEEPKILHKFIGIDDVCDPAFQYNPKLFRTEFSKPRRMATHDQEVKEIREALKRGVLRPGREYIKKSSLWKGVRQ